MNKVRQENLGYILFTSCFVSGKINRGMMIDNEDCTYTTNIVFRNALIWTIFCSYKYSSSSKELENILEYVMLLTKYINLLPSLAHLKHIVTIKFMQWRKTFWKKDTFPEDILMMMHFSLSFFTLPFVVISFWDYSWENWHWLATCVTCCLSTKP